LGLFAEEAHLNILQRRKNVKGLLRRLFPKGMKLGDVLKNKIDDAQFFNNIRP